MMDRGGVQVTTNTTASVEYARRLYDDVLRWYQSADTKAQVVLGIDGAFIAFLASGMFRNPGNLRAMVATFSPWTWVFLGATITSLLLSIFAAISCLWSRIYSAAELRQILQRSAGVGSAPPVYPPQVMWFFQMVAALDPDGFRQRLAQADDAFEVEAMASQIHILSGNVRTKHRAANLGFLFTATTLCLFLFAGISYVLKGVA